MTIYKEKRDFAGDIASLGMFLKTVLQNLFFEMKIGTKQKAEKQTPHSIKLSYLN